MGETFSYEEVIASQYAPPVLAEEVQASEYFTVRSLSDSYLGWFSGALLTGGSIILRNSHRGSGNFAFPVPNETEQTESLREQISSSIEESAEVQVEEIFQEIATDSESSQERVLDSTEPSLELSDSSTEESAEVQTEEISREIVTSSDSSQERESDSAEISQELSDSSTEESIEVQDGEESTQTKLTEEKPSLFTTQIYYPNGDVITHLGQSIPDLSRVQYKVHSAQQTTESDADIIYIDKSHPAFNGLKAGVEAYIAGKSRAEIQAIIESAFQADSDNDGIIDSADKNPNVWNVSDRDLRIFSTLAYEPKERLQETFNHRNTGLNALNGGAIKVGDTDMATSDLALMAKNWTLLQFDSPGSGLQYAVFGNGKKDDGSVWTTIISTMMLIEMV